MEGREKEWKGEAVQYGRKSCADRRMGKQRNEMKTDDILYKEG